MGKKIMTTFLSALWGAMVVLGIWGVTSDITILCQLGATSLFFCGLALIITLIFFFVKYWDVEA